MAPRRSFLHRFRGAQWPTREVIDFALALPSPDAIKVLADLLLILVAAGWTWLLAFGQAEQMRDPMPIIAAIAVARLLVYGALRLHRTSWLYVSRYEVFTLFLSALLGVPVIALLIHLLPEPLTLRSLPRPALVFATEPALYLIVLCGARITVRAIAHTRWRGKLRRRVLILGAGATGHGLAYQLQELRRECEVIGFLDDAPRQKGRRVRGLPVLGLIADLPRVASQHQVEELVIAIPSLEPARLREILALCEGTSLPVRILPPLRQYLGGAAGADGNIDPRFLREVQMEDLLPRPEVQLDRASIAGYLSDRVVMVTGGGGSIGSELCRQARAAGAKKLVILGRGENSVFEILQELKETPGDTPCELVPVICDVRDRAALDRVFLSHRPAVVFHAAAHKHVPLMELYPGEAVKNNVLGTLNVAELAAQHRVERFVMVSSDKAVDPCSVMGATKRLGEMIVRGLAATTGCNMASVRFGNVLGSRGSVVLTMRNQIRRGRPVTVTDPDMVRFFMTIPEAVQLILQAGAIGGNGQVFVLDMGQPVRILDLAHDLIRLSGLVPNQDIPIHIIGRRPGEKVEEAILSHQEEKVATRNGAFFVAPSPEIEMTVLRAHIERLKQCAEAGDNKTLLDLLQKAVPDFHHESFSGHKNGHANGNGNGHSKAVTPIITAANGIVAKNGTYTNGTTHHEDTEEAIAPAAAL